MQHMLKVLCSGSLLVLGSTAFSRGELRKVKMTMADGGTIRQVCLADFPDSGEFEVQVNKVDGHHQVSLEEFPGLVMMIELGQSTQLDRAMDVAGAAAVARQVALRRSYPLFFDHPSGEDLVRILVEVRAEVRDIEERERRELAWSRQRPSQGAIVDRAGDLTGYRTPKRTNPWS